MLTSCYRRSLAGGGRSRGDHRRLPRHRHRGLRLPGGRRRGVAVSTLRRTHDSGARGAGSWPSTRRPNVRIDGRWPTELAYESWPRALRGASRPFGLLSGPGNALDCRRGGCEAGHPGEKQPSHASTPTCLDWSTSVRRRGGMREAAHEDVSAGAPIATVTDAGATSSPAPDAVTQPPAQTATEVEPATAAAAVAASEPAPARASVTRVADTPPVADARCTRCRPARHIHGDVHGARRWHRHCDAGGDRGPNSRSATGAAVFAGLADGSLHRPDPGRVPGRGVGWHRHRGPDRVARRTVSSCTRATKPSSRATTTAARGSRDTGLLRRELAPWVVPQGTAHCQLPIAGRRRVSRRERRDVACGARRSRRARSRRASPAW